jgi:hypothetical protein
MAGPEHLSIKIVEPRPDDLKAPEGSSGPRKVFGEVTPELRNRLADQVRSVREHFAASFQQFPSLPAVARVRLKEKALAKSHRPTGLFTTSTTPIIGTRGFGELLVSVRGDGLDRLARRIGEESSKARTADISTIESISPYAETDAVPSGVDSLAQVLGTQGGILKLRLFDHQNTATNDILYASLLQQLRKLEMGDPEGLPYGRGTRIFRLRGVRPEAVVPLARFVGTQSLSTFPHYLALRAASVRIRPLQPIDFPPPQTGRDYPVVGIIDSGTNPDDPFIDPWVVARHVYVPENGRIFDHGSFVAGLVIHPRRLNGADAGFPEGAAKIVDVAAIQAPPDGLSEDQLVTLLEEVLPKHPDVRVWNLSLAGAAPCSDHFFSDLAIKLDDLQDRYGVTFVLAAGNYTDPPFRGWPPDDHGEKDRICGPADSVRGITVGSVAHLARSTSRVQKGQPSPFSRRGPGPVYTPKPEVAHFGGNCDDRGGYTQTGVLSTDGAGYIVENIGTSFATPLVATLVANTSQALAQPVSRNLLKALVIHSAVLGGEVLTAEAIRYRGFGIPGDILDVITCAPWAATLVFEPELVHGLEFARDHFPIPASMRSHSNKVRGEIVMTLVYDPPLDGAFGAEYCRTNVDASLGSYDIGKDGKRQHRRLIPPEPEDIRELYERQLIEHGFKWSPVKVYRRSMRGLSGRNWRLRIELLSRSGFLPTETQRVSLVVTLLDPEKKAPVYDEVVRLMQRQGWVTTDLEVQARIRA